jgi:DNA processing protein
VPKLEPSTLFSGPLRTTTLSDEERIACLRLARSESIGPVTFRELLNHFGSAAKALDAIPELSRRGGARRPIYLCSEADAIRELEAANRIGSKLVFTIEPDYPPLLTKIEAPPPLLHVKGRDSLLSAPAIAIVGSRQCSAAGAQMTRLFANRLANAGLVIVSGLARGIDRVAHEAALATGTVAVLAGGIDWTYPPEHAELQSRIACEGCLVTDRPPGFRPRDKDFPRRNRIIAGLVHGVVVIEAAARSGTLVTARYANDLGREVFALPGHPLDPRAEGTNRLIKQGATLVTTPEEVIDVLRPIVGLEECNLTGAANTAIPPTAAQSQSLTPSTAGEREINAVIAALGPAPAAIDAIARTTGLSVQVVQIALLELDLAGRVERQGSSLVALKSG